MRRAALILLPLTLAGCAAKPMSRVPSGQPVAARSSSAAIPAGAGDPPPERNGTLPATANLKESKPSAHALAPTPRAALRAYALTYADWNAASLPAHERKLAELAVGPARLVAQQTAAAQAIDTELAADHVRNEATILAIAPGEGPMHGQWVIVTQERTTGTGPYAGLPSALRVTLARVQRLYDGWAVSQWQPAA
jgi:hypothetical protein